MEAVEAARAAGEAAGFSAEAGAGAAGGLLALLGPALLPLLPALLALLEPALLPPGACRGLRAGKDLKAFSSRRSASPSAKPMLR